ncbi:MAG: carbohydrate kinase family protein [Eubacteriales bacterium]|nr:carbohydrate kinase family protein [Eubacteriales bacterium]
MPRAIALCTPVSDYLVHIDKMPRPGQNARMIDDSWQFGGNAATAIVTAARQGLSAGIIGAVGDDTNGRAQRIDFQRHQVETCGLIVRPGMATPYVISLSDDATHSRSFLGARRPFEPIRPEEIDLNYLKTAQYLLLDSPTEASRMAAALIRGQGGEVMFDASMHSPQQESMLEYATIYITSEYYWETRYQRADVFECCRDMMAHGPHTVIFTLGEQGCAGIGPDGPFQLPAFPVDRVIDTTGCGDTFHGAYIVGMERGLSPVECARWASASSAIKCTAIGGRAAQPTAAEVEAFLATGRIELKDLPERLAYYRQLHSEEQEPDSSGLDSSTC